MSAENQQTEGQPNGQAPQDDKSLEKKQKDPLAPKPGDNATAMDFSSGENFALLQRVAKLLSESDLVPAIYRGKLANCVIALNMAERLRADPLQIMQNLYIVQGKPGWSAKFLIATINQSGGFSKLRYEWKGEQGQPEWGCRAWAIEKLTNERLDGPWITWKLANDEGWVNKNGSKWKTMPLKMFMYRAGAWFVDVYAPELSMGLPTSEDLEDAPIIDLTRSGDGYGFHEVPESPEEPAKPNGSLADQLKAKRESRPPAPEAPAESVVDPSTSTETQEATEQTEGDGGMAAEDAMRAEAQALYDKCVTAKKKMTAQEKLTKAFKTPNVKEIPAERLGEAIDLLTAMLEG
jgi:hypothetical protein